MSVEVLKQIWPEWQIEGKPLGKGSFGVVYKAVRRDHNVESYAAIKVISIPADPSEVDSLRSEGLDMNATRTYLQGIVNDFVSEIQLMESLKGVQNIVSVEDYKVVEKANEIGWDIYIRMELLTSFNTYICDKKLTEEEIIKLGCDICTALEICAKRNIIHRDIKPENIFINDFGYFKLGDFGIARKMENMTGGLSQKGTFNYMAPEVANSSEYDARVDTYSLGIVLYRLLNGNRLPFLDTEKQLLNPNERRNAVDRRIRGEELPAPCEASPAMADLILRACAYDPDMRFSSATEMKQALMSVANGTYQMAASNLDRTTSVRRAPANYDKTTSVRKAPTASNQKSAPAVNTFGSAPKKKNKMPAVIAAVLAVVLLVGVGIFAVPKLIDDNETTESGETSSNTPSETVDYSKFDEEQIASIISEAEALAAEEDYEGALVKIQTGLVTYPKSADLQNKADEYTEKLQEQAIASILSEAEALASEEDYEGALAKVQTGLIAYPDSVKLQNKADEYNEALNAQIKEKTLAEAKSLADSGDYVSAIVLIKNAQENQGDDAEYQSAFKTYSSAYKTEVIASADALAANGDYVGALEAVGTASAVVGNDAELSAKATEYENNYVAGIIEQADGLLVVGEFDSAETLVNEAKKQFPQNEQLKAESEKIKNARPVYLLSEVDPYMTPYHYNDSGILSMGGQNYTHGFSCMGYGDSPTGNKTYFNLDGKYSLISFTAGIVSDAGRKVGFTFYADGELVYGFTMESGDLPTEHIFSVEGCKQLVIGVYDGYSVAMYSGTYGIADIMVTKNLSNSSDNITNSLQDGEAYLLKTVEPYKSPYHYNADSIISMGGHTYSHGFTCMGYGDSPVGNETYFNLGGKYSTLKFTAGIVSDAGSVKFSVYADGELIYTFDMESGALPTNHTVDITGCKQLVFAVYDGRSVAMYSGTYGIADIIIG